MSFMAEIEKLMNGAQCSLNYRVVNLGGKSVYIEGFKSVVSLTDTEMIFQLKNNSVVVAGKNLKIKYLDKFTCVIEGAISGVFEK